MPPEIKVQHDPAGLRFFVPLEGGAEAFLRYRWEGKTLNFYQTYVSPDARQKGLAEQIVEAGFLYAKEKGLRVIPSCSYVSAAFLRRRPEFLPLTQSA